MDSNEFNKIKQEVLEQPVCFRELEAKEIVAMGENYYKVGDATFSVDSNVANKIDLFSGIKRGQSQIALDSYGDQGVTNLRNFFGQAGAKKSERIVLTANTRTKKIVEATPIKDRMITPNVFFDFAEMFMDKNQYIPDKVEFTQGISDRVSILMRPVQEQFMEFSKGDEFMSNGIYLMWTPGEVSMGNYYERLVCVNGVTQMSHHSMTKAFSPNVKDFERMLNMTALSAPLKQNIEQMLLNARLAKETQASVHELGVAAKILTKHGLTEEDANQIIPYIQTKEMYESAGYLMDTEHMALAKSDKTMWELFNMLTYFATHNEIWAPQDIRRSSLMESSMNLLLKKRDIKEYYNIF